MSADSQGYFAFQNLGAGQYLIEAAALGYMAGGYGQTFPGTDLLPLDLSTTGSVSRLVTVKLWKNPSISGRVSIEQNEPAANVTVSAVQLGLSGAARPVPAATAKTDTDGFFHLMALAPGDYLVGILGGLTTASNDEARLAGGVAAGQMVRPSVFYPSGSIARAQEITVAAGDDVQGIDLFWPAEESAEVSGVVLAADAPANGAFVRAVLADVDGLALPGDITASATTSTDTEGRFRLLLAPGVYRVSAARVPVRNPDQSLSRALLGWAETVISVTRDISPPLQLQLRDGVTVSGRFVVAPGSIPPTPGPARNASVGLVPIGFPRVWNLGDSSTPDNRVADDGTFRLGPFIPGQYLMNVALALRNWSVDTITSLGRDIDGGVLDMTAADVDVLITLTDRPGRVDVQADVRPGQDAGLVVLLFPADPDRWINAASDARRFQQRTVQAGACMFDAIPSGSYLVVAKSPGAIPPNWRKPAAIARLSAGAARFTVRIGERVTVAAPARQP